MNDSQILISEFVIDGEFAYELFTDSVTSTLKKFASKYHIFQEDDEMVGAEHQLNLLKGQIGNLHIAIMANFGDDIFWKGDRLVGAFLLNIFYNDVINKSSGNAWEIYNDIENAFAWTDTEYYDDNGYTESDYLEVALTFNDHRIGVLLSDSATVGNLVSLMIRHMEDTRNAFQRKIESIYT